MLDISRILIKVVFNVYLRITVTLEEGVKNFDILGDILSTWPVRGRNLSFYVSTPSLTTTLIS